MSIYSTSLKKVVFEPRQFSSSSGRCEFRLDSGNTMYFNNLRLVNVGAMCSVAIDSYNRAAGGYGILKSIVLLDGSQELDRCDETNQYLAWYNKLAKNADNYYINQRLVKHNIGGRAEDVENRVTGNFAASNQVAVDTTTDVAVQQQATTWLDLRNCLPLLSAMGALDSKLMPNLRIQIEFDKSAISVIQSSNKVITILEPLLVADEIVDDSMKAGLRAGMKDVMWKTYEHDLVIIPAGTISAANTDNTGVVQSVSRTINGFDNKYVHRLVAMKTYSDPSVAVNSGAAGAVLDANLVQGYGNFISRVQHREKIQFQINGSNLLVGEGLTSPAMRADLHDECWGSLNVAPYGIYQSVGLDTPRTTGNAISRGANLVGTSNVGNAMSSSNHVGADDYIGVRIEERVSDLQLSFERACLNDVSDNLLESTELAIHLYAEVPKQLTLDGQGSYTVSYL